VKNATTYRFSSYQAHLKYPQQQEISNGEVGLLRLLPRLRREYSVMRKLHNLAKNYVVIVANNKLPGLAKLTLRAGQPTSKRT